MPIIPRFDLTQTLTHIIVTIRVPHVRVSPDQVQVVLTDENTVLHFASPPYLLVINFAVPRTTTSITAQTTTPNNEQQQRFHESAEESCARYEPTIENGIITLELRKETPGIWENLDLLGRMVWQNDNNDNVNRNLIDGISGRRGGGAGARWLQCVQGDDQNSPILYGSTDSAAQQSGVEDDTHARLLVESNGYGFLRLFHGVFTDLHRDGLAKEMLELPWQESWSHHLDVIPSTGAINVHQLRRVRRREIENSKFEPERYLGDMDIADDYVYQCALAAIPHWHQNSVEHLSQQLASLSVQLEECSSLKKSFFTDEERTTLMSIPYPLLPGISDKIKEKALLAGLLDILYAYVYDHLITDGEPTVESAWTISTLSASLSCLDDWIDDAKSDRAFASVVRSSLRRALVYPYIRNLDWAKLVWAQVSELLCQGLRPVLRSLLQTRSILERSELYYLGNKLYIDPYLKWLQTKKSVEDEFMSIVAEIEECLVNRNLKSELDLDLIEIESTGPLQSDGSSSPSDSSDDGSGDENDSSEAESSSENSETDNHQSGRAASEARLNDTLLVGDRSPPSILVMAHEDGTSQAADIASPPPAAQGTPLIQVIGSTSLE